jgi:hypothetical protein
LERSEPRFAVAPLGGQAWEEVTGGDGVGGFGGVGGGGGEGESGGEAGTAGSIWVPGSGDEYPLTPRIR